MNNDVRRSRLKGAREAERILQILDVRPRLMSTHERVDVFDALAWLDVRVMFRPLDGLMGAYLRGDQPGALISTNRPLSVQRFTAAHELGHAILDHEPSLDSPSVLRRAANSKSSRKILGFASYLQEIEADAFAGAFLLPQWLITHHARKQGWSRSSLSNPDIVYQLSLRCGSSFQATAWALERHGFIQAETRAYMLGLKPRTIKAELGHVATVAQTRADAWNLTKGDAGADIALIVGDTVSVSLDQQAGGGYLWRPRTAPHPQLTAISENATIDRASIGAPSKRRVLYKAETSGTVDLQLQHKRPWEDVGIEHVDFTIQVEEPERGLSRANRKRMTVQARQQRENNVSGI